MKIYSWNVNGIRGVLKKNLFYPFLETHQPDILCLQETKAERGQFEIDLPGYSEYWNSAVKKGYSGTAIFAKTEPIAVINGFPQDIADRFHFTDERRVGVVVHAMFQRLNPDHPEWNRGTVEAALLAQGLAGERLQEAARRVEAALQTTLVDSRGRWILSRHDEDRREFALSGIVDGRLRSFVLDRTFVDESDVRWIVDYKTGIHEGGDLEGFLDNEQARYRSQLERYASIVSRLDSRPIRLGLYFPALSGWREWKFEGSQP